MQSGKLERAELLVGEIETATVRDLSSDSADVCRPSAPSRGTVPYGLRITRTVRVEPLRLLALAATRMAAAYFPYFMDCHFLFIERTTVAIRTACMFPTY